MCLIWEVINGTPCTDLGTHRTNIVFRIFPTVTPWTHRILPLASRDLRTCPFHMIYIFVHRHLSVATTRCKSYSY